MADSEEALAEACGFVDIEYEELPGVFDPEEALRGRRLDGPRSWQPARRVEHRPGRRGRSLRSCRRDRRGHATRHRRSIMPAWSPRRALAGWTTRACSPSGSPRRSWSTYRDVARILGIPESRVRVIAPYVGGGFGGKEDMTVEPYLGLAVWHTRRPVRMQWTRQESLMARPKRHRMRLRYRTAARSDGTMLGQEVDITADSGAYAYVSALVLLYSSVHACGPVPGGQCAAACPVRLHQ